MSLTASELQLLRAIDSSSPRPRQVKTPSLPSASLSATLTASLNPALRGYVTSAKPLVRTPEPPSHVGERTLLVNAFLNGIRQFIGSNSDAGVLSAAELASGYVQAHNLVRHPDYRKIQSALPGNDEVIRLAFAEFLMAYIHRRFMGTKPSKTSFTKSGMDIHVAQGLYSLLVSPKAESIRTQQIVDLAFALLPELSSRVNWFSALIDRVVMLGLPKANPAMLRKLYEIDALPPL